MKCKNIKICFSGETEQGFVSPEKQKIHTYGYENLDVTYVKNLPGPGFTNRKGTKYNRLPQPLFTFSSAF